MGATEEERRETAATPLFRAALRRVSELERSEAAVFVKSVGQTNGSFPADATLHNLEAAGSSSS